MAAKCEAKGCDTALMPASFGTNTVVVTLRPDGEIDARKICDACRRKLCTCERCSAFCKQDGYEGGNCLRESPKPVSYWQLRDGTANADPSYETPYLKCDDWCRDGWHQARPWTAEEVEKLLGSDDDELESI